MSAVVALYTPAPVGCGLVDRPVAAQQVLPGAGKPGVVPSFR